MPNKEQVERLTERFYQDAKKTGTKPNREAIRKEIIKRAKKIDHRS